jgi:putative transposase
MSVPPTLAPSRLAGSMKGKSSFKIQQEYTAIRKRYWGQHFWACGIFCATTGIVTDEMTKAYIGNHAAHENSTDGFEVEG